MPTIIFASPKGGVGKSTSALVLATELAGRGANVAVIDADPNKPLSRWAARPGRPDKLTVQADVREDTIIDAIETAERQAQFVIVDLEGTANMLVAYAMSRADLVIIPCQGSQLDAAEAVKAIKLVKRQEKAFTRTIPCAVLFTRTSAAIGTRDLKDIQAQLAEAGVQTFTKHMVERAAFRALFSYGGTLGGLDPSQVSNIDAAKRNATAFAHEVVQLLKSHGKPLQREVA
ncbi:ParA family protein [Methylobacterium sp. DCY52]|jgi:chromosome partitioning protein|uniref:ParA family protein n=1 Tax=Methylobacterium sp. DCY52 TaxID=739139 RepID=UPI003144F92F